MICKSRLHVCLPSVMCSRCLALHPRSVWVIPPRAVLWCSAQTLWTILCSEPGSKSVYAPPAAQPQTLPTAPAPTPTLSLTKASTPSIALAPKNPSPSSMLHYCPNQHQLFQAPTPPNGPLQVVPPPPWFQLSETPFSSKTSNQNPASPCPDTYPQLGSRQGSWFLHLVMSKAGPCLNHAGIPKPPWTHPRLPWPVLAGRLCSKPQSRSLTWANFSLWSIFNSGCTVPLSISY